MQTSQSFKSSTSALLSPTGSHTACIADSRLQIRPLRTLEIEHNIALPASIDRRTARLAWSPPARTWHNRPASTSSPNITPPRRPTPPEASNRILIATPTTILVHDLRDPAFRATISNGSGGLGSNAHVQFGSHEDEVLVWSEFGASLKIWCVKSGRVVEVRDPKFGGAGGKGWGFRPTGDAEGEGKKAGVLALLCASAGQDTLVLLAPGTYKVLARVQLPTTDAAGLKWSLDGRWLAVWEAAGMGYKICIYTADGCLFRTLNRETPASDDPESSPYEIDGLGVKTLDWVPGNAFLAVGGWDRRVRILSTRTFAPVVFLEHSPIIHVPTAPVYTESIDASGTRSYALTPQPVTPPRAPAEKGESAPSVMKAGIGLLAFSPDGAFCATRDDATPCVVWIWDLRKLRPACILIQYAPVKSLIWHASEAGTLLVHTAQEEPVAYVWRPEEVDSEPSSSTTAPGPPQIVSLAQQLPPSANGLAAKYTATWLPAPQRAKPVLMMSHAQAYVLVWPQGKDTILRFDKPEGEEDEGSDDSLFEILTGRKPAPQIAPDTDMDITRDSIGSIASGSGLDDTFRGKRKAPDTSGRVEPQQKDGLADSGMDEMF